MIHTQNKLLWVNAGRELLHYSPRKKFTYLVLSSFSPLFPHTICFGPWMRENSLSGENMPSPVIGSLAHSPLVTEVMGAQGHVKVPEDGSWFRIMKILGEAPIHTAGFMWMTKIHFFLKPLSLWLVCYCSMTWPILTDTAGQISSHPGRPN